MLLFNVCRLVQRMSPLVEHQWLLLHWMQVLRLSQLLERRLKKDHWMRHLLSQLHQLVVLSGALLSYCCCFGYGVYGLDLLDLFFLHVHVLLHYLHAHQMVHAYRTVHVQVDHLLVYQVHHVHRVHQVQVVLVL